MIAGAMRLEHPVAPAAGRNSPPKRLQRVASRPAQVVRDVRDDRGETDFICAAHWSAQTCSGKISAKSALPVSLNW